MNTIFKILGLILGLGALSAFPIYQVLKKGKNRPKIAVFDPIPRDKVAQTVQAISHEGSSVADTLHEELNAEHDRLLIELQKQFPQLQDQWQEMLAELEAAKAKDMLVVENPAIIKNNDQYIQEALEILVQNSIDPARVNVYTIDDAHNPSWASAGQGYDQTGIIHELKLNKAQLANRPTAIRKAIITHEIMHLLHYDCLAHTFIISFLEANGISSQEYKANPAFRAYCRIKELRADLCAASTDIEIANAFKDDFEESKKQNPEEFAQSYITHPSKLQRHQAVTQLVGYIQAEKQQIIA